MVGETVAMNFKAIGAAGVRQQMGGLNASTLKLAGSIAAFQIAADLAVQSVQKLSQFIGESVDKFREFETRMAEVSTILGSDTLPMMDKLTAGVEALSMKFGQATSDMAKGLYDILSAAFAAKDAINLLNTATKASIAGLTDVRTSVDIFTTILNSYGMAVEQATHVSNVLFQAVIRGKFQFVEFGSALQYVIPIAAQAGIQIEELTAALSTATRHGLRLDMTSRGLALAIQNIVNPSEQAKAAAMKYGIEMNGLALRVMGLHGWFVELNAATKEFGQSILGELVPNMRSLRVAMVLAGDVGLAGFSEDLERLAEMGNATEIALNKIMDTSQFVSNQIAQEWEKMSRETGKGWDEMILSWQRSITGFVKFLTGQTAEGTGIAGQYIVSEDAIENAKTYMEIAQKIEDVSKRIIELEKASEEYKEKYPLSDFKIAGRYEGKNISTELASLKVEFLDLTETQLDFADGWNKVKAGITGAVDEVGDLQLTLYNVELSIEKLRDRLEKPIEYGWGDFQERYEQQYKIEDGLKGTLYYELEVLKAEQRYADATHDVNMGLQMANYNYKEIPDNIQRAIEITRNYTEEQKKNRQATDEMTAAMRGYNLQIMEIQLKGMMRRRGLTRGEERRIKKIQIEQTKMRIANMKSQKMVTESNVKAYNTQQDVIDDYILKLKEERYQLNYTYDQEIQDLKDLIASEHTALQTRYDWWEKINQDIIDTADQLIEDVNLLAADDEFGPMLEDWIGSAEKLIGLMEDISGKARGGAGTYPSPPPPPPTCTVPRDFVGPPPPGCVRESYQRGGYIPRDMPIMAHRGETILPAGSQRTTNISPVINIYIDADINNDMDLDNLASRIAYTTAAELTGKYELR